MPLFRISGVRLDPECSAFYADCEATERILEQKMITETQFSRLQPWFSGILCLLRFNRI